LRNNEECVGGTFIKNEKKSPVGRICVANKGAGFSQGARGEKRRDREPNRHKKRKKRWEKKNQVINTQKEYTNRKFWV